MPPIAHAPVSFDDAVAHLVSTLYAALKNPTEIELEYVRVRKQHLYLAYQIMGADRALQIERNNLLQNATQLGEIITHLDVLQNEAEAERDGLWPLQWDAALEVRAGLLSDCVAGRISLKHKHANLRQLCAQVQGLALQQHVLVKRLVAPENCEVPAAVQQQEAGVVAADHSSVAAVVQPSAGARKLGGMVKTGASKLVVAAKAGARKLVQAVKSGARKLAQAVKSGVVALQYQSSTSAHSQHQSSADVDLVDVDLVNELGQHQSSADVDVVDLVDELAAPARQLDQPSHGEQHGQHDGELVPVPSWDELVAAPESKLPSPKARRSIVHQLNLVAQHRFFDALAEQRRQSEAVHADPTFRWKLDFLLDTPELLASELAKLAAATTTCPAATAAAAAVQSMSAEALAAVLGNIPLPSHGMASEQHFGATVSLLCQGRRRESYKCAQADALQRAAKAAALKIARETRKATMTPDELEAERVAAAAHSLAREDKRVIQAFTFAKEELAKLLVDGNTKFKPKSLTKSEMEDLLYKEKREPSSAPGGLGGTSTNDMRDEGNRSCQTAPMRTAQVTRTLPPVGAPNREHLLALDARVFQGLEQHQIDDFRAALQAFVDGPLRECTCTATKAHMLATMFLDFHLKRIFNTPGMPLPTLDKNYIQKVYRLVYKETKVDFGADDYGNTDASFEVFCRLLPDGVELPSSVGMNAIITDQGGNGYQNMVMHVIIAVQREVLAYMARSLGHKKHSVSMCVLHKLFATDKRSDRLRETYPITAEEQQLMVFLEAGGVAFDPLVASSLKTKLREGVALLHHLQRNLDTLPEKQRRVISYVPIATSYSPQHIQISRHTLSGLIGMLGDKHKQAILTAVRAKLQEDDEALDRFLTKDRKLRANWTACKGCAGNIPASKALFALMFRVETQLTREGRARFYEEVDSGYSDANAAPRGNFAWRWFDYSLTSNWYACHLLYSLAPKSAAAADDNGGGGIGFGDNMQDIVYNRFTRFGGVDPGRGTLAQLCEVNPHDLDEKRAA